MIQLTDNLAITADDMQYIVGKPRQKADGTFRIDSPRYYPNLAQAVQSAVMRALRQKVARDEITTLRGCIDEMEHLTREFQKLIEPLNKEG